MAHYAPVHCRELLWPVQTHHADVTLTPLRLGSRSSRRTFSESLHLSRPLCRLYRGHGPSDLAAGHALSGNTWKSCEKWDSSVVAMMSSGRCLNLRSCGGSVGLLFRPRHNSFQGYFSQHTKEWGGKKRLRRRSGMHCCVWERHFDIYSQVRRWDQIITAVQPKTLKKTPERKMTAHRPL